MTDIESFGYPLVYKAAKDKTKPSGLHTQGEQIGIRAEVHALTGMQKEALVYDSSTGTTWRMVSDEGPYLNGTDLAPFPLAFFTAGMAFSFTDEVLKHATTTGVKIKNYRLTQNNYYTMEGSAIRGDMMGGALPVEMLVEIESDAPEGMIFQIIEKAKKTSPAQKYMSQILANTFALSHNGNSIPVDRVNASTNPMRYDPANHLKEAQPAFSETYSEGIIQKLETAETVFGVEGGAGSSLQATQKRTLHVCGICTIREDGIKEARVQLFKPLGSTFRFLSDHREANRAPSSLAYLAAGVGFCFMTQIGRYAQIVKMDLKGYRIVQDTIFKTTADHAEAEPVNTHLFLETGEPDSIAQKTLRMSEQTCFLHASMRSPIQPKIQVVLK